MQNNNWKSALLGADKDFPELATSMQAAAAAVSHGLRFQGSRVSTVHAMAVSTARVGMAMHNTQPHIAVSTAAQQQFRLIVGYIYRTVYCQWGHLAGGGWQNGSVRRRLPCGW